MPRSSAGLPGISSAQVILRAAKELGAQPLLDAFQNVFTLTNTTAIVFFSFVLGKWRQLGS